jgi:hypothetical protein
MTDSRVRGRFPRLFPISPLSTAFARNFSLPRLGQQAHCHQVIGTAVPASSESPQGWTGAAGDQRSDLRRQAIAEALRSGSGASREEAPEESTSSSATRLRTVFGPGTAKRDAREVDPRRAAERRTVLAGNRVRKNQRPKCQCRTGWKSTHSFGIAKTSRPVGLLLWRELSDAKRRLSW